MVQNSAPHLELDFLNWLNVYFLLNGFGGLVVYNVSQGSRQSFPIVLLQYIEPVIELFYETTESSDLNSQARTRW